MCVGALFITAGDQCRVLIAGASAKPQNEEVSKAPAPNPDWVLFARSSARARWPRQEGSSRGCARPADQRLLLLRLSIESRPISARSLSRAPSSDRLHPGARPASVFCSRCSAEDAKSGRRQLNRRNRTKSLRQMFDRRLCSPVAWADLFERNVHPDALRCTSKLEGALLPPRLPDGSRNSSSLRGLQVIERLRDSSEESADGPRSVLSSLKG